MCIRYSCSMARISLSDSSVCRETSEKFSFDNDFISLFQGQGAFIDNCRQ
jgi:hypothetical protein